MTQDVLIIDDCVALSSQDQIESTFLGGSFPWYYVPSANFGYLDNNTVDSGRKSLYNIPNAVDTPHFVHTILSVNNEWSNYFPTIVPLISSIPYTIKNLIRIKANITNYNINYNKDSFGIPHTDIFDVPNYHTAIYYINDSDGDTYIFNETYENKQFNNLTIKNRITPKKGRLIVFPGSYLHSGNNPSTNNPRAVLNFNFTIHTG